MHKLIKDGVITEDNWHFISGDDAVIPDGPVLVSLPLWQAKKQQLGKRKELGIWLDSDESPRLIADDIEKFQVIAINFPAFTDGRGFTYARELREQMNFKGELRAIGSFIRDQLYYLKRCGFNAFKLENTDIEAAISSLNDFSNAYQAASDNPVPLFRRRNP